MSKILLIDDSVPIREMLKAVLAPESHQILEATDGDMGVTMARESAPDLIILDMNMPKMTGWEVGPILRTHPTTKDIPIIALTADQSTQGREKAYEAGCNFFVTKPVTAERVLNAVTAALGNFKQVEIKPAEADATVSKRVLIVDDDSLMRSLLAGLVDGLGAEVVGEAENGNEAVEAFKRFQPTITFLDINMPVKDGVWALQEIMEIDPRATIVMLSANDDTSIAESCLYAGARNYVKKGDGPEELRASLKAVLG